MTEPMWNQFLTERDKAVLAAAGYGRRAGFGKRPALLVIDVNRSFCGDRSEPILDSIKTWKNSCGEDAWNAIPHIRRLLDSAHQRGLPVFYTTGARRADEWDMGGWRWKNARFKGTGDAAVPSPPPGGNDIVDAIAPIATDIMVLKQKPSAFFATNLASYLTLLQCDSVVVTGTTTSGCVRATVVDAFSLNLRVTIAEEACFDRSQASHAISLFDLNAKYADVVQTDEVIAYFDSLPEGLFELPDGKDS
jgi:maleamate amidohydrolase